MPGTTLGVLVAGGRGERLGLGAPKALVQVGGMTLLARGLATLAACCDQVVVAAPAGLELPIPVDARAGTRRVPVRAAHDGPGRSVPLAGVVAGLTAVPFTRALVLGVDYPLATPALLGALLVMLDAHDVVLPVADGVAQPLVAACTTAALAGLRRALEGGEQSLARAWRRLGPRLVPAAELPDGEEGLLDVDTIDDLARAEARLGARGTSGERP